MRKAKKGVSPVIATVLLIMITIILAVIILLWSRGFIQEVVSKEIAGETKRVEQRCYELELNAILNSDETFGFNNIGNVPVYAFNIKTTETGKGKSTITKVTADNSGSVNPSYTIMIDSGMLSNPDADNYDKIEIIPILLGTVKSGGTKEFECPERSSLIIK